jgi:Malectin domain
LEQSGLRNWIADAYFTGGNTYSITSIDVSKTADMAIYQSERTGEFSYSIPVPIGTYEINIHLAEM